MGYSMSNYTANDSAILAALKAGDVLSPAIAHERWGTLALHSAIARLRKAGHKISTRMVNGHGEYRIVSETKAAAQVADASFTTNRASSVGASKGEPPASAAPVPPSEYTVGQQYRMFGRRVLILADGISAYDGTRFTEVRDLGPWGG